MREKSATYASLNLPSTARFFADKACDLSSASPDDTLALARAHYAAGHHRRAIHLLSTAGLDATSLPAQLLAAQCAVAVGDFDGALAALGGDADDDDSMADVENEAPAAQRRGHREMRDGFGVGAAADTPEIRAALCVMRGRVYEVLENCERATWWFKRALVCDLFCYEAHVALADAALLSPDEVAAFVAEITAGRGEEGVAAEANAGYATPVAPMGGGKTARRRVMTSGVEDGQQQAEATAWMCAFYRVRVDRTGTLPPAPVSANGEAVAEEDEVDASTARVANTPAEVLVANKKMRDNLDVLVVRAMRLFAALDYEECARLTSHILDRDPYVEESVTIMHLAALVELDLRHELFVLAHSLVDTGPRDAVSWMAVGYYYFSCGKYVTARRYLQKATSIDARLGQAWIAFGHAFAAEDESDQAMSSYRTASRLCPGAQLPLLYMGMEYTRQSSLVHAASFFQSAREACPSDPAPRHELGVIAYKMGDVQGAVAYFKAAISLWEKNDGSKDFVARGGRRAEAEEATMFNMGHCYRRLREFELAKDCYQRALSLQPRSASTCSALGMTLHALGDCSSAVAMYHRALRFNPEDALSVAGLDRALNDMTLD